MRRKIVSVHDESWSTPEPRIEQRGEDEIVVRWGPKTSVTQLYNGVKQAEAMDPTARTPGFEFEIVPQGAHAHPYAMAPSLSMGVMVQPAPCAPCERLAASSPSALETPTEAPAPPPAASPSTPSAPRKKLKIRLP